MLRRWLRESDYARALLGDEPAIEGLRGGIIPSGRPRRAMGACSCSATRPASRTHSPPKASTRRCTPAGWRPGPDDEPERRRGGAGLREPAAGAERNERTARAIRATFGIAVEPFARRALHRPGLALRLNTDVFFTKRGFAPFIWGLLRAW